MKHPKVIRQVVFCSAALACSRPAFGDELFKAAGRNDISEVKALLAKGADVNAKDQSGETPLFSAAFSNAKDVAALLIDKGADVNAKDQLGNTPLVWAAVQNAKDVASLLIARGADINAKGPSGQTPLFCAAMGDAKDVAALLVDKGADVNAKDSHGKTPLEEAEEKHSDNVAALLRNTMTQQESRGDVAATAGKLREAFNHYMSAATSRFNGTDLDTTANLRIKIAEIVGKLDPRPAVPEEAERHNARGAGLIEVAKNSEDFADAANEFQKARDLAPWWTDPYSNEGVAREKASQYAAAISCLKVYLALKPSETDARPAQNRIYALEARMEKATKEKEKREETQQKEDALAQALVGTWYSKEQGPMEENTRRVIL